jgi:hypothetical protein
MNRHIFEKYIVNKFENIKYDIDRNMIIMIDLIQSTGRLHQQIKKNKVYVDHQFKNHILPIPIKNLCIPIYQPIHFSFSEEETEKINAVIMDTTINVLFLDKGQWYEFYNFSKTDNVYKTEPAIYKKEEPILSETDKNNSSVKKDIYNLYFKDTINYSYEWIEVIPCIVVIYYFCSCSY